MRLDTKTLKYLRENVTTKVLAVYLSGSRLNGLADKNSDTDYYVVTEPEFDDLIFNRRKGKQDHGEIDFKQVDLFQFVNLIYKSNPNVLELFYKKPLYSDDLFMVMANYLYKHRDEFLELNPVHWQKSCLGQMKHCYLNIKKNQGATAQGHIGKDVVQFIKAFAYLEASYETGSLDKAIDLDKVTSGLASSFKATTEFSDEGRVKLLTSLEGRMVEAQNFDLDNEVDWELLEQLMDVTKRAYTILCVSELSGLRAVE
ncbi:DNA polymerase beta superfamily protein [Levilactobacillus enshiensis]|uniref:DNA polymerase beta superfamily protein n=1 Tax=Levilactobacillus enshiensis TaxID=2590213 RepID=UPI00117A4A99|nr:nucleotidyltransferase domain-containing protein [Levilactobacillus enshiensis]